MGTPSSWPPACKRAVLVTASFVVLMGYLTMCVALIRLSVLLIH
jgi:hypothetical protein